MQSETKALPAGLHVLLVEDEPLVGLDCGDILRSFGVDDVTWVRAAADALRAIETQAFHAAILDLRLGTGTSFPLAEQLEKLGVPFGFLTGYTDNDIPAPFRDRPMVSKPFAAEQLLQLVQRLIGA